ncbi:MAG: asparagine synthase (glutamine-hydrolyzing) [Phycisphaerales bacterium]|nr:asparagine synthase (glutamine-hydrolyzing) [Phycisphaerales bacterium]
MCGICGVVRFDDRPADGESVERACSLLRHRGPDHTGVWTSDGRGSGHGERVGAALGATRLAVLDPRSDADQPFHRGDRFHLVYNGELYNFRDLRRELKAVGESFVTDGDTEVVLAACARWGGDALQRFDGMWAIAFYDATERRGFLARDPFGIKPLLYATGAGQLAFASELRALACLGPWDRGIDPSALVQHLSFGYIAHPATIHRGARRLPPGHFLPFGPSGPGEPQRYYEPRSAADPDTPRDYTQSCSAIRRRIADAVVRQRVSDVPIGAFLSGGLDSSIIVLHLAEATGRPIRTFSVGYADQQAYDERRFARLVASRFGTQHEEVVLTERDVLDAIPRILDHLGEPVGDSSIIPTALLAQVARRYVTVALSGDGGDELFGGYWRYLAHASLASYRRIPGLLRTRLIEPLLASMSASRSSSFGNRVRQFRKLLRAGGDDALARHVAWSRILAPEAEALFCDDELVSACERATVDLARRLTADGRSDDPLHRVLTFDLQHQLPADMLAKVDFASMMHSLEVRVPLLDRAVVEAATAMPSCYKIDRGLRKRILTDAYRGRLPDEVLDRPKQGFEVPIGEFLRGPLRELFHDTVTRDAVESFGLLSYPAVEFIFDDHLQRRADHADLLWALLSLCWWRRLSG